MHRTDEGSPPAPFFELSYDFVLRSL